jgi:hypothetical protein
MRNPSMYGFGSTGAVGSDIGVDHDENTGAAAAGAD